MASTDISGEPILILGLRDVKILESLLDKPVTPDQDKVIQRIATFLNDPDCTGWEHGLS